MWNHKWFSSLWIIFLLLVSVISSHAQQNLPAIVKKIQPSTVVIQTYDHKGKPLLQGSGFFISKNGDVITNYNVLEGASSAIVKTASGKSYSVNMVVADDEEGDLIRISVDIPQGAVQSLPLVTTFPEVGERILVIGNPLGREYTVSDGIVSAVQEIPGYGNLIQISAPISQGSSGSPVVNMKGQVIGVATFLMVEGQNLNFAIPSTRIASLILHKGWSLAGFQTFKAAFYFTLGEDHLNVIRDFEKGCSFFTLEDDVITNNDTGKSINEKLYDTAIEAFKKAIRAKPDWAEAYFYLGQAYDYGRRHVFSIDGFKYSWEDVIKAYEQAVRLKPDYAEAYTHLGDAYHMVTGRDREAVEAYKQAVYLKPDWAYAYCNLGYYYLELALNERNKQGPRSPIVTTAMNGAIEALKQAICLEPDSIHAHFHLGRYYVIVGDRASALDEYKILKELDRGNSRLPSGYFADGLFNLIY